MRLSLLFFALYRDLAGIDRKEIEVPPGVTVGELVRFVRNLPGLDWLPPEPVVAVNQEYASPDLVLQRADEVAFLPPVAGG